MTIATSRTKRRLGAETDGLQPLFDFDLHGIPSKVPVVSAKDREGVFITNAAGTIRGEKLHGKIWMTFFAKDCAYLLVQAGIEPPAGQHLCKENDGGVIETDDGAKILFDTKGYGLRGADPANPSKWRLAMTVQFSTNDNRYKWLNTAFAYWEGQFDDAKGIASYKSYMANIPNDSMQ